MRIASESALMPAAVAADKKTSSSAACAADTGLLSACRGFEAIILHKLLAAARPQEEDGLFGRSFAREMYESMQDEAVAGEMAKAGGIGLADALYRRLSAPAAAAGANLDGVA